MKESLSPLSVKSPCCVCFRGIPTLSGDDADDWKHQLFDFLIDGELVRMSLEEFLLAKGISVIQEPSLHDDWVSVVDGSNPGYAIVRDMTTAALSLNKFCYGGLIAAHRNKTPLMDDTTAKVKNSRICFICSLCVIKREKSNTLLGFN